MTDSEAHPAPSLDRLRQAFAEAMGRNRPTIDGPNDANSPDQLNESTDPDDGENIAQPNSDDASPISPQTILEAMLFVGHPENQPITGELVAGLLRGVDESEVEDLVVALNEEYSSTNIPFHIIEDGEGYRMELRNDFDYVRERFYGRIRQARLSQKAVDVLAVVAYNQPVTRKEVDKLLNDDNTGRVLNQLVRRELLAPKVNDDKPRRKEFVTTDRFLALFNLSELGDLPRSEDPE